MSTSTESTPAPSSNAALVRWLVVLGVTFAVLAAGFIWIARSLTETAATAGESAAGGTLTAAPGTHPAPDFQLASLDGPVVAAGDFKGKAVIIDFWATWCGPCKVQAKMLERLHEELDGKGVEFLAVNVGEDEETVRSYVAETPFSYSVLLDPTEELSAQYQIYGLPTIMVIGRNGEVSFLRTGLTDIPTLKKVLAEVGVSA